MKIRLQYTLLALMIIVSNVLASLTITNGHNWGDDFASYIMQTQSLIHNTPNEFVTHNAFTIKNSSIILAPYAYPWGFPILLVPVYALFGLNPVALKLWNFVSWSFFLLCAFLLFRRYVSHNIALAITSIFAFDATLLLWHDNILSDIPFLAISTLFFVLLDDIKVAGQQIVGSIRKGGMFGGVAFLAFWIRPNGLLLLAVLGAIQLAAIYRTWDLFHLKWRSQIPYLVAPYATFLLLHIVTSQMLVGAGQGYPPPSLDLEVIKDNARYYFQDLAQVYQFLPNNMVIYGISLPFFAFGLIRDLRREYHFALYIALIVFLYLTLIQQPVRYLFPVWPFYIYFVVQGARSSLAAILPHPRASRIILAAGWLTLIGLLAIASLKNAENNLNNNRRIVGPFSPLSMQMFDFVKQNTDPTSVIIFFKPRALRLFTNRDAIMIDNCSDISRGDYLISYKAPDHETIHQVPPSLLPNCAEWPQMRIVYENLDYTVYKLNKG